MSTIKKVWSGEWPTNNYLLTLSIESANADEVHRRIQVTEHLFPATPTPTNPLRHTICIGLLDEDDINMLAQHFDTIRTDRIPPV